MSNSFFQSLSTNLFIKAFVFVFKFLCLYFLLCFLCLLIIFGCGYVLIGEQWPAFSGISSFEDMLHYFNALKTHFIQKFPLADFLNNVASSYNINGTDVFFEIFTKLTASEKSKVWSDFCADILPNLANLSLASLVFHILSRINILFKNLSNIAFTISFFFASFLWTISGFCVSVTIIECLKLYFNSSCLPLLYFIVIAFSILIHTFLLSLGHKTSPFFVFVILILDIIFGAVNSFIIWLLFSLFDTTNMEIIFTAISIFFVCCLFLLIEEKIKSAMLYSIRFRKSSRAQ